MSKSKNSLHRTMCEEAARILHKGSFEGWHPFKYVAIELMTYGKEIPDVWATNGAGTAIVEVKTSRADFLCDAAKHCRQNPIDGIGNFRWYYALQGIIKEEELPADWGLAEAVENGKMIRLVRTAAYQESAALGSISILCSIMRREGIKGQIFNYHKKNGTAGK
ncbi:hypothetical protein E4T81_12535 [Barnesiella sp. WM24]|uniref:hypothetical protein n=1 Tax=Barnesiella sp. WM24 TaxID=2558278 RepID=UPI0010729E68|nr:hypothetical protein [Barnesiella sp. WM24]TFU92410.1 hypothetical protein E4T81_12535 [Barnesiella sp. WM24]